MHSCFQAHLIYGDILVSGMIRWPSSPHKVLWCSLYHHTESRFTCCWVHELPMQNVLSWAPCDTMHVSLTWPSNRWLWQQTCFPLSSEHLGKLVLPSAYWGCYTLPEAQSALTPLVEHFWAGHTAMCICSSDKGLKLVAGVIKKPFHLINVCLWWLVRLLNTADV